MQINIRIVLLLLSIISISYPKITVADEKLKFAGITLGLTSQEVISKLLNEPQYTVYITDGSRLNDNTSIFLGDNSDTTIYDKRIADHPLYFKVNCKSMILTSGKNGDGNFLNLRTIGYNQQMIQLPNLIFIEDKLISWKGNISMSLADYDNLIDALLKKYGKSSLKKMPNPNYNYNEWKVNNTVLGIYPSYEHIKSKVGIKIYNQSNIELFFSCYDEKEVINCKNEKDRYEQKEKEELITKDQDIFSVCGFNTSMSKEEVYQTLKRQDQGYIYWGNDLASKYNGSYSFSFIDKYSNGQPISSDEVLTNWNKLPDTTVFVKKYLGIEVNISISFYKNMLLDISLSGGPTVNHQKIYNSLSKFISMNINNAKRSYSSKNGLLRDSIILNSDKQNLSIVHFNDMGTGIVLQNKELINARNGNKNSSIQQEIGKLLVNLDNSVLYNIKLGSSVDNFLKMSGQFDNYERSFDPYEQKRIPIDYNYQKNGMKYYEYNMLYRNEYIETDSKIKDTWGEPYCCHTKLIEVVTENDNVKSISTSISPIFYKNSNEIIKDKSVIMKTMIDHLVKKYGEAVSVEYLTRKSKYWKVNDNIFEIVIEDKGPLQRTNSTTSEHSVYFIFRKYSPNDLIFKKSSKKGLLD